MHLEETATDYPAKVVRLGSVIDPLSQSIKVFGRIDGQAGVLLPGMSGIALIEMLRARGDNLPAILITGTGDIAMAVQAMRSGASDFIERPVSRRELIDSIERAVSHASTTGGARRSDNTAVARRLATLTKRQKDVLDMVMAGLAMSALWMCANTAMTWT
mgnify:CR=1 FL=1